MFSHYFGLSDAADVFSAAFRIPNFLQNLFGEGVLSASFIPVYARLLAHKDEEEAGRVAGAVLAILSLVTSLLVVAGSARHAAPFLMVITVVCRGSATVARAIPGGPESSFPVLDAGDVRHGASAFSTAIAVSFSPTRLRSSGMWR